MRRATINRPTRAPGRHLLAVLLVVALAAAACGSDSDTGDDAAGATDTSGEENGATTERDGSDGDDGGPDGSEAGTGGVLRYGTDIDGTGFDTTSAVQPGSTRFILAMVDPLVAIDGEGNWHPYLAESLTPNDDATVWTVTLREGIEFHDGEPLDAEAVKANIEAVRASPTVGFALAPVGEITVIDPLTVEFTMLLPWAAFPFQLSGQAGWMVSPSTIGTNDRAVGTGPFVFDSWTPGDSFRAVRNESYWRADEGLPRLDAIEFKVIPDQVSRRQALAAGDIDAYFTPADEDIVAFQDDDGVDVYTADGNSNEYMVLLNTAVAPLDDLRVRQAMAHAIDRQLLIDTFRSGLTTPATGPLAPTDRFYHETDYPAFDLEAGAALIEAYEAEVGPAELTLISQNRPAALESAEVIASFWSDVGIDVTVEPVEPGATVNRVIADDFQSITWFQFGGADPDELWVFMHSGGGILNWSNLSDPELDAGLDQGRTSTDPEARQAGYAAVQERLTAQLPFLWIDHLGGIESVAARPEYQGLGESTTPEGVAIRTLQNGSFHSYETLSLAGG